MSFDDLLTALQQALQDRTDWNVYLSYDPTPFEMRETQFLVLGIDTLEAEEPFLTSTTLCYAFSAKLHVTMLAPPDTDESALCASFCADVMSGLLSSWLAMHDVTYGVPSYSRQFQKLQMHADFVLRGVYQIRREEVAYEWTDPCDTAAHVSGDV